MHAELLALSPRKSVPKLALAGDICTILPLYSLGLLTISKDLNYGCQASMSIYLVDHKNFLHHLARIFYNNNDLNQTGCIVSRSLELKD